MKIHQFTRVALLIAAIVGLSAGCGKDDPVMSMNGTGTAGVDAPEQQAGASGMTTAGQRAMEPGMAGRASTAGMSAAGRGMTTAGTMGSAGTMGTPAAGTGGAAGEMEMPTAGTGAAGMDPSPDAGTPDSGMTGMGSCCSDGDCLCHGDAPSALTSAEGPYATDSYTIPAGCVYYPTDAEPPFAAVAISDGFVGSGGCVLAQTGGWGPLYASHGIVAMIINTTGADQPPTRGRKLGTGIAAFKEENERSDSPLFGKLAGRYGTSGFSMGGGGTTYATQDDPSLLSSVAVMPWGPVSLGVTVPTLVICGVADTIAPCALHGAPLYGGLGDDVPKMRVDVTAGHSGQPTAGGGRAGEFGLAFQKVFLEGDERWRPLLVAADAAATNIE
jgi:hypothetical protein